MKTPWPNVGSSNAICPSPQLVKQQQTLGRFLQRGGKSARHRHSAGGPRRIAAAGIDHQQFEGGPAAVELLIDALQRDHGGGRLVFLGFGWAKIARPLGRNAVPTEADDHQIFLLDEPAGRIEQQFQLPLDIRLERQKPFLVRVVVHDDHLVGGKARFDQLGRQIALIGAGKFQTGEIRIFVDANKQRPALTRPFVFAAEERMPGDQLADHGQE